MRLDVARIFWESGVLGWSDQKIIAQIPLIYEEGGLEGGRGNIVVRCDSRDGGQCEFPLAITPKRLDSMCHLSPNLFKPVFIGQLRDLPEKNFLRMRILKHFSCAEDDWVMLAAAPFVSTRRIRKNSSPANFITRINVKGNVQPFAYVNMNAWYGAEMEIHPSKKKPAPRKTMPEQNMCIPGL